MTEIDETSVALIREHYVNYDAEVVALCDMVLKSMKDTKRRLAEADKLMDDLKAKFHELGCAEAINEPLDMHTEFIKAITS